jgi:rhamnosyltransferase
MNFAVCIPTLNAGPLAGELATAVQAQTARPSRILVVDSSSDDGTAEAFRSRGAEVMTIRREDFDHGGTRQAAVDALGDSVEVVLFLTQDAIPADDTAFARLVASFRDETVAAAYGRQLPRSGARVAEAHARLFNYPASSRVKTLADAHELGIKTPFLSNSFSAYRVVALRRIGGFPSRTLFGEDMETAGKLLIEGCRIAYVADACVRHSHSYTWSEELRRYFDIGVFHARNPWLRERFGGAGSEGLRYVRSELAYAAAHEPFAVPSLLVRNTLKLAGMQLGRHEASLPLSVKRRITMNRAYWSRVEK